MFQFLRPPYSPPNFMTKLTDSYFNSFLASFRGWLVAAPIVSVGSVWSFWPPSSPPDLLGLLCVLSSHWSRLWVEITASWQVVDADSVTLVTGQFQSIGCSALIGKASPISDRFNASSNTSTLGCSVCPVIAPQTWIYTQTPDHQI